MTFFSLNFDLINTAELCGLDIRASTLGNDEVEACCPYCCDHRYRMYLIRLTNMFYCHNCGTGGNAVTLYSSFNPNGVTLKNYESYKRLFWPIDQKGIDDFMLFRKLKKEYEEKIKEERTMTQSYNIRIEETVTENFPVTADSPEEAVSKARRLYYDGKLVLEPGTLIGMRIGCTNTESYVPEDFRGESYV